MSDAAGNITDSYAYDAYGITLHQTGATANPYLYRGEQFDADLSADYRYMYGNNDPTNTLDPSGEISLPEILITAGITGTLSNIGISELGRTEWGRNAMYPYLAEHIYPEGFIR